MTVDVKGQFTKQTAFYVRAGNSSRDLRDDDKSKYIRSRWPGPLPAAGCRPRLSGSASWTRRPS